MYHFVKYLYVRERERERSYKTHGVWLESRTCDDDAEEQSVWG